MLSAKLFAHIANLLHQPPVLGKLIAGVVLGPTVLNILAHFPYPEEVEFLTKNFAEIGVVLLMFVAGMETNLNELKKVGLVSLLSGTLGVLFPFVGGYLLSRAFGYPSKESLFIGTILTATSVSISAQTLLEMHKLRTKEGMGILGAAVIDDVEGIILLSFVIAFSRPEAGGADAVAALLFQMILFFAVVLFFSVFFLPKALEWFASLSATESLLAGTLIFCFLFSFLAESFGKVAAITGAYIAGLFIAQTSYKADLEEKVKAIAYGLFVPVFFIHIGFVTDGKMFFKSPLYSTLLILVAIVTKIAGCFLGARVARFPKKESFRLSLGMISRGEVALIVASIGLDSKVISNDIFAYMIVMTLVTTIVTPVFLRYSYKREEDEAKR